jgi:hypothetical protein
MPLSRLDAAADLYEQGLTGPRTFLVRDNDELIDLTAHRDARRILDAHDSIAAFVASLDELPPSA